MNLQSKKLLIPAWYHPTSMLAYDDSEAMLDILAMVIPDNVGYQSCYREQDALDVVRSAPTFPFSDAINSILYGLPHKPERFLILSILMVDFDLPGANGIQFLNSLTPSPAKRILFSGSPTGESGIHALKNGIVDHWIAKQNIDVYEELTKTITRLQYQFFLAMSSAQFAELPSILCSYPVLNVLRQRQFDLNVEEYYLYRDAQKFLLLDINGIAYDLEFRGLGFNNEGITQGETEDSYFKYWQLSLADRNINRHIVPSSFRKTSKTPVF